MANRFRDFYLGLSSESRDELARRAAISRKYIEQHLVGNDPARRKAARIETMHALAKAGAALSDTAPTYVDLVLYFYLERPIPVGASKAQVPSIQKSIPSWQGD